MQNFKHVFKMRLQAVPAKVILIVLALAVIGFADATYLTVEHYQNVIPPCSITGGCEKVLTSSFSEVFGIPVSLLGSIYYLLIAVGLFSFLESKNHEVLRVTLFATGLGFLASLWFVFLQVFIIHAYCAYCMGSATASTVIFIMTVIIFKTYGQNINNTLN